MTKIKIFREVNAWVEEDINTWLEKRKDIEVLNISIAYNGDSSNIATVIVTYKVKEEEPKPVRINTNEP